MKKGQTKGKNMWNSYKVNNIISIGEMYSFFDKDYAENYDFRGESHNFWECVYVIRGNLCVTADQRVYNLSQNQIVFHKPMEFHKFRVTSKHGAKLLVMSFSLFGTASDYFADKVFSLNGEQEDIIHSMLKYAQGQTKAEDIRGSILKKYLAPSLSSASYMQIITTYIYRLFLLLAQSKAVSYVSSDADAGLFGAAVCYMNSNVDKNLLISDISSYLNISESGLKRIFSKYAGIGVHKYFTGLKIKAATELLRSGVSVSETSQRLGFSSQGYFSGVYKRETGTIAKSQKISLLK